MANAFCERLNGTIRRECVDFIPMNERHLWRTLREWAEHYNSGRPHRALGPGIPATGAVKTITARRHHIPAGYQVLTKPILLGRHHEYALEKAA